MEEQSFEARLRRAREQTEQASMSLNSGPPAGPGGPPEFTFNPADAFASPGGMYPPAGEGTPDSTDSSALGLVASIGAAREAAHRLKRQKKLSALAEADLDAFVDTPGHLSTHQVLLKGDLISIKETQQAILQLLKSFSTEKTVDAVKSNCITYVKASLLAAGTKYYRGLLADAIFGIMRALDVNGVPPASETGQVAAAISIIGDAATRLRCEFKNTITASHAPQSDHRNIAKLAVALVGSTNLQITLPMLQRLAFIRDHAKPPPPPPPGVKAPKEEDFWVSLDNKLDQIRSSDPAATQLFFNDVFAQDQLVFGAATATELELTRVSDLSTVQSTVERHMLSVKPTPKRKAGKRTRAAVIEAENQDETA